MRAVLVALFVAIPSFARADLLTRVLDDADGAGGGTTTPAPATEAPPPLDDLLAWAGAPKAIELPQILQIALHQAPSLAGARIDVEVAEAQIAETWARNDWHVQAQATGNKTVSAFGGFAYTSEQYGVTGDLIRSLPTNGTFDLHVQSSYSNTNFGTTFGSSQLWSDQVTAQITQPLLKGRGRWLFEVNQRKAELQRDAQELARRLAAINTVEAVISAYWDLVLAERQLAITQKSLDLARERLRVTEIGVRGGKTADAEVPAVLQIIATREEDVLNGELAVLDASIALRRAAGMPIGPGDLGLRVAQDLEIRERDTALGPLVQRAFAASPELAQLAKQRTSATLDIEVTENGLLPQLDAMLSFGPTGQRGAFKDAGEDMAEFKNLSFAGSLTFSRSLQQRDVRYRAQELRAAREKLTVTAFDIRSQLTQSMARELAQLELAKRRVALARTAIELANKNIEIETTRFNLGTRTNFDVLNRQEDLRQAELREAQAEVDWHKADNVVMALTGDLLPAFGITVQ